VVGYLGDDLGNVLSVLAASAFLPVLPMLPLQILVQNLAYDLAQLSLPLDNVDAEQLRRPHRWNTRDGMTMAGDVDRQPVPRDDAPVELLLTMT